MPQFIEANSMLLHRQESREGISHSGTDGLLVRKHCQCKLSVYLSEIILNFCDLSALISSSPL